MILSETENKTERPPSVNHSAKTIQYHHHHHHHYHHHHNGTDLDFQQSLV